MFSGWVLQGALPIVLSLALVAACFSERSAATAPSLGGECRVPLTADLLGATVIVVRDFSFQPTNISVKQGGKVIWVNCSASGDPPHTSTADGGAWDSPTLAPGAAYGRTFDQVGSFPYHGSPHPFLTGTVIVEP
jgi:plastocyanin